jgi:hypothetical protein
MGKQLWAEGGFRLVHALCAELSNYEISSGFKAYSEGKLYLELAYTGNALNNILQHSRYFGLLSKCPITVERTWNVARLGDCAKRALVLVQYPLEAETETQSNSTGSFLLRVLSVLLVAMVAVLLFVIQGEVYIQLQLWIQDFL